MMCGPKVSLKSTILIWAVWHAVPSFFLPPDVFNVGSGHGGGKGFFHLDLSVNHLVYSDW